MRRKGNSIQNFNIYFILIFAFFELLFFYFYFKNNFNFEKGFIILLIINIIFVIYFISKNILFHKEFDNTFKGGIKALLVSNHVRDKEKKLLNKNFSFSENLEAYGAFKRLYLKKNIIKKDYEELKDIFIKFLPEKFLEEIGSIGRDRGPLGLSLKKNLHVMFFDIIGFSAISEKLTPEKALMLLNIYFDGVVDIVTKNGGYIDKFLGDGIMIIFEGKYSDSILESAIEIDNFINKMQISDLGKKIGVGIGINSGEVIFGTIGAKNRMDLTIIGDTVNIASRLESLTRQKKYPILISENTFKLIKNKKLTERFNQLGEEKLKGKKISINIYGVNNK